MYASRAAKAANIAQAESAVNAARANQIAAQSAVVRAEREALAARGTAVQTQMSIQLAQARMAEAGATTALGGAQATLRTASAGLLSVLGGPVGLALLVGTMAASYFLFRDGANAATSALIDQNGTLDDSIQKFKELSAEQQRFQSSKWVEAQESALDSASSALAEYATRGSQAFNSLGMSGVESAEAFSVMVAEVKAGTRTLDSVTEWVAKNNQIMPAFKSMLEQTAAAYSANGEKAEKYGKLLAQSSGVTTSATTETEKLAAAQKAAAESSGAKAGEWDKYIAKLTETRDLIGANSAAEAEYNAVKMGASVEQRTQAKLIGEQTVVLKALQEAVKDGDKVEQAALKTKLLGLYTAEEAAKQAAATQKQAYADTATAAEESAKRQAAAFMAVAAASYAPVMANPNPKKLSGYGLLTNGGTSPAVVPEVPETALERYERAIKLINEGTEVNKKTDKAVNAAAKAIENQAKALKDFEAQSAISTKSSNDMADAYLSGADSVRELAIQQKIEEELLKTGAGA
ncbi:tail tape measure protein, partial [Pseudomonas putida]